MRSELAEQAFNKYSITFSKLTANLSELNFIIYVPLKCACGSRKKWSRPGILIRLRLTTGNTFTGTLQEPFFLKNSSIRNFRVRKDFHWKGPKRLCLRWMPSWKKAHSLAPMNS